MTVLQGYLTIAGFPTSVDGDFGPQTAASVAAFKQAHNLTPPNGVAGPSFVTRVARGDQLVHERRADGVDDDQPGRHGDRAGRRAGRGTGR